MRRPKPVQFAPARKVFEAQVKVRMYKDVSGWVDRKRRIKWSLSRGEIYYLDADTAAEFITKGYCAGDLPRKVSDDERAEWMAQIVTIAPGGP